MAEFTGRLVLRPSFTEEDVDEMAWDLNWDLVHHKKPEGDSEVDIWLTKNKEVEIHLIDDRLVGLRYFTLRGDKGEEVASQIAEEGYSGRRRTRWLRSVLRAVSVTS